MSWGRIPQGAICVSDSIRKYEHSKSVIGIKNYRVKILFKLRDVKNVKWGVWVLIINCKQSQTIRINNNETGSCARRHPIVCAIQDDDNIPCQTSF